MIQFLTCFKCWGGKAVLTYEENRVYKISCECGCSYTFEHCSMKAAQEYHNKMLELHGEIDRNAKLKAENERLSARVAACEDAEEQGRLVVDVVRCKDCARRVYLSGKNKGKERCDIYKNFGYGDFYCAHGEAAEAALTANNDSTGGQRRHIDTKDGDTLYG